MLEKNRPGYLVMFKIKICCTCVSPSINTVYTSYMCCKWPAHAMRLLEQSAIYLWIVLAQFAHD
jgi:hypothetical protein